MKAFQYPWGAGLFLLGLHPHAMACTRCSTKAKPLSIVAGDKFLIESTEFVGGSVVELLGGPNSLQNVLACCPELSKELLLKVTNVLHSDPVEEATSTAKDRACLLLHGNRNILILLQQLE